MAEEGLISPPPRDSLILKRRAAIQSDMEEKMDDKISSCLALYEKIPREFAKHYFKGKVSFDELSKAEKREFKKICLRRFARNCFFSVAPFSLGMLALFLAVINKGSLAMVAAGIFGPMVSMLGWMLLYTVHSCCLGNFDLSDQADFIRIHLFLKRHNLLEKK